MKQGGQESSWDRWGRVREQGRGLERALKELFKGFEEELVDLGEGFEAGWTGELLGALEKGSEAGPRPQEDLERVRQGF